MSFQERGDVWVMRCWLAAGRFLACDDLHCGLWGEKHYVNKHMQFKPTRTPLLYSKTGVQGYILFHQSLRFWHFSGKFYIEYDLSVDFCVTNMYPNGKLNH